MNITISKNEGKWLMLSLLIPKLFFTTIYNIVNRSLTGANIEIIYISLIMLVLTAIFLKMYSSFGGNDIFSITHYVGGKTGVLLFGTLMFILSVLNTATMLRIFSSVISLLILKGSTIFFVMVFISLSMYFSAVKGVTAVSKVSVLWGAIVFTLLAFIILMSVKELEVTNIFPLLGNGYESILSGYKDLPVFYELIYFIFIIPYLGDSYKKAGYRSIITFSSVFFILTLFYVFLVPYPASVSFKFPVLHIASSVNIDILFQRVEALYLIALIFSSLMYLSATFAISINIAQNTFCISDHKGITGAVLVTIVSLALCISNTQRAFEYYKTLSTIIFVVGFSVIIVILTLANIKNKISKEELRK